MKKLYILFLITAALLIGGYLFVRFYLQADIRKSRNKLGDTVSTSPGNPDSTVDLRPLFIAKIQQVVKEGSKGLYNITIDSMEVDMLQSQVILQNVNVTHNPKVLKLLDSLKQAPGDVFKLSFDTLKINGVNLDDVITRKTIDFREVNVVGPIIEVYHSKRPYNRKTVDTVTLFERIMKDMTKIAIGKVLIQRGVFISHNLEKKSKANELNDVEIRFDNILIDSSTEHAKDRFLFARKASLSVKNYALKTKDDVYEFKIGAMTVYAPQKNMIIKDLTLNSLYNKQEFQKTLTYQKEQYDLKVPEITIRNIDWWALMNEELFIAKELIATDVALKIHLDRSLPRPKSKMGNFPHQLIMKLPIKVHVSSMNTRNMNITYEEYNPKSQQTGSVRLDDVNLNISNITNITAAIKKIKRTVVTGNARFKGVPVQSRFDFDLQRYKTGNFSANLTTGGFESKIMNNIAEPLGLVKIEKGNVQKIDISMKGNEIHASGKVLMLYKDFKVSLYEKEKDEKGLDKKGVIGFLANTFVIKDDNPANNKPPRHPSAEFQRDPQTGFFNLVWKTALTGILKTIGANPGLAKKKQ
jgi:hypothetical protein